MIQHRTIFHSIGSVGGVVDDVTVQRLGFLSNI